MINLFFVFFLFFNTFHIVRNYFSSLQVESTLLTNMVFIRMHSVQNISINLLNGFRISGLFPWL